MSSTKKIVALAVFIAVLIISVVGFVLFFSYTVSGKLLDVVTLKPVAGVVITDGSYQATSASDGTYSIAGVKIYQRQQLTFSSINGYVDHAAVLPTYSTARQVTQNIAMEPTLVATVALVNQAQDNELPGYLWKIMHPDDQGTWKSQADFTTAMKSVWAFGASTKDVISGTKISGAITKANNWTNPIDGLVYQNVFLVPITYTETINGAALVKTRTDHYQEIMGFFHYFPTTSEKVISATAAATTAN